MSPLPRSLAPVRRNSLSIAALALCLLFAAPFLAAQAGAPSAGAAKPLGGDKALAAVNARWAQGLFNATPAELLATARQVTDSPNQPVMVYWQKASYHFAADGSMTRTLRMAYRILNQDGVRNWGSTSLGYSPWHQDRPQIRARVTNDDGKSYELDPASLVEGRRGAEDGQVYSDMVTLEGPFPQIRVGSIVEEEVSTRTRPVMEGGGLSGRWWFSSSVPVVSCQLELSAETGVNLSVKTDGPGVPASSERLEIGRKVRSWVRNSLEASESKEGNFPRDFAPLPVVLFTSAPGWEELGNAYAKLIDRQIESKPASLPAGMVVAGDARATARKLTEWITAHVRYIGLELGENSIVPYCPADILARGHGDCKDKASLLVSFLRQAGIDASVALVFNDGSYDVHPGIPGMDQFNHAIVKVDADGGFWVDPTVEWGRELRLPEWDQDRNALVARNGGSRLEKTTSYAPATNENVQISEYVLQDRDNADLTETVTYGGDFDLYHRSRHLYRENKELQEGLEEYAKGSYENAKLKKWWSGDPRDLHTAFYLRLEMGDSGVGTTWLDNARLRVDPGELIGWLPQALRDKKASPRQAPYRLAYPFKLRQFHRIQAPEGFSLRAQPEEYERQFGSVRFSQATRLLDDGRLEIELGLETTQQVLSAKEFETTRLALVEYLDKLQMITVLYDHQARVLFDEERYAEAFELYRSLAAKAPDRSIHQIRLSRALLEFGLGGDALAAARKAVNLAPVDAEAWDNLAWVSQFDQLGRRFGSGWDRSGARAAYARLFSLSPERDYSRADYAIMLEYGSDGLRYGPGADLAEAISQYAKIKVPLKDIKLEAAPVIDHFRLGRFAEAEAGAATLSDAGQRETFLLATRSIRQGTAAAVAAMNRQTSREDQRKYLAEAGNQLGMVGQYQAAAELLRLAAKGAADAANLEYRADLLAKVKPWSPAPEGPSSPVEAVHAWLSLLASGAPADDPRLLALQTPRLVELSAARVLGEASHDRLLRDAFAQSLRSGIPARYLSDMILSLSEFESSGDEQTGWHVKLGIPILPGVPALGLVVEKTDGAYRIGAHNGLPQSYASRIRELVAKEDWKAAAAWLDWFMADLVEPNQALASLVAGSWPNSKGASAAAISLASLWISVIFPGSPDDITRFDSTLDGLGDEAKQKLLSLRLGGAFTLRDPALVLEAAARLHAFKPDSLDFRNTWFDALLAKQDYAALDAALAEALKKAPADRTLRRYRLRSLAFQHQLAEIERLVKVEKWTLESEEYNNIAWAGLFSPTISEQALEYARKAVNLTKSNDRATLHTLAALYAETGRFAEARTLMNKVMELSQSGEPSDYDWYVFARIAEGYGFIDTAVSHYSKVERPETDDPLETWHLAQKHLKEIASRQ